jgi:hypothetical protein
VRIQALPRPTAQANQNQPHKKALQKLQGFLLLYI